MPGNNPPGHEIRAGNNGSLPEGAGGFDDIVGLPAGIGIPAGFEAMEPALDTNDDKVPLVPICRHCRSPLP